MAAPFVAAFAAVAHQSYNTTSGRSRRLNFNSYWDIPDQESDSDWAERIKSLRTDCLTALRQYHAMRVFLPKAVAERMQSFIVSVRRNIVKHNIQIEATSLRDAREKFNNIFNADYERIAEAFAQEARELLGVEAMPPELGGIT